jgi:hypothetical protein
MKVQQDSADGLQGSADVRGAGVNFMNLPISKKKFFDEVLSKNFGQIFMPTIASKN